MSAVKRRLRGGLSVQKVGALPLDEAVVAVQFLQGSRLAALTAAGGVWLAEGTTANGRRIGEHAEGGLTLAVQPGGSLVASGGQDGRVQLWRAADGSRAATVEAGTNWVERLAWRPDGSRLAATVGRRVGVWTAVGEPVGMSDEHASTVADIAWQPDGARIATAAYGGVAYLTAVAAGPTDHVALKGSSLVLGWQPQGRYLACGNQDATVLFVLVETGDTLQMWGFPAKVLALSWSEDGRWLATAAGSGVILWDASGPGPKGRTPTVLEGHSGSVTTVAWQPQGQMLASGGTDGQVCLFMPTLRRPRTSRVADAPPEIEAEDSIALEAEVTALAWTTGGGMLAVGDRLGTLSIYRVA
ncbi:MAG: WD40 repeat domain-containing protein [Pirellulales bacterium]|nr:WD40 repeat domain-containing protein [Pirellulales bacterium]